MGTAYGLTEQVHHDPTELGTVTGREEATNGNEEERQSRQDVGREETDEDQEAEDEVEEDDLFEDDEEEDEDE